MPAESLVNYLSLRQFPGGTGWITRLEKAAESYCKAQTVIGPAELDAARKYLKGEILEDPPLAGAEWAMLVQPFEDVRMLFMYTQDDEFGSRLQFYVHQSARGEVPTEDLAFLLDFYLQILGQQEIFATLLTEPHQEFIPINHFPRLEIPFEDIQRILYALDHLSLELNSKVKLARAAEFARAALLDELCDNGVYKTLLAQPAANIALRFQFPTDNQCPFQVSASDTLAYLPSNLALYLVSAYANAFARGIGSMFRVNFNGLCHYFHVAKFE